MVLFEKALQGMLAQLFAAGKGTYDAFEVPHKRTEETARKYMKHRKPAQRNVTKKVASSNGSIRWVFVSDDGILQSINSPIVVEDSSDGGNLVVLARMGDSIAGDAFVSMPLEMFDGVTMALMKDGQANEVGINKLDGAVLALVKTNADLVSLGELNWESSTFPNAPVAVPLDNVFPVPPTYQSCNGHDIRDALPDDTDTKKIWKPFRVWLESIRHQYENMDGYSLHVDAHNGAIAPANFTDPGSGQPKGEFFDDKQEIGANLQQTIFTIVQPIASTDPIVQENLSDMKEQIKRAIIPEVVLHDDPGGAPTPQKPVDNPTPTPSSDVTKCLETIQGLVKSSTEGSKHMQRKELSERGIKFYQCGFASEILGSDGQMILEPATLTAAATKMLEAHDPQTGLKLFREGMDDTKFQEKANRTILGASCDFNSETVNPAFATCLKAYHWHKHPLSHCLLTLDQALSILQFLPCSLTNKSFLKMVASNNRAFYDYLHNEIDKNKGGMTILVKKFDLTDAFRLLPLHHE